MIIKKPIYKFQDMTVEVQQKIFSNLFVCITAFIISIIFFVYTKDLSIFLGLTCVFLFLIVLTLYDFLLFSYDKVFCIEGRIVKIDYLKGIHRKYKDIYILKDGIYNILTISKQKKDYQLGVVVRLYIVPSNVINKNKNTYKVRNPIITTILEAEYDEGENIDDTKKNSKIRNTETLDDL